MAPIDGTTELYGIIGNPVRHSLSPVIHNSAFQQLGLNKVYVAFPTIDAVAGVNALKALGVLGASVTVPHKQNVLPCLDTIDPVAARIGAVNTLIISDNKVHGLNTDWTGANKALEAVMPLAGSKVILLGSGGAARAIGFGLQTAGASIILVSRGPEKGKALAAALACEWLPLAALAELSGDALVNATSAGMAPSTENTPTPAAILPQFPVIMDIVYSPVETRLLREARAAGNTVVNGLAMLLHQGAAQFEAWTGMPAPLDTMRAALEQQLSRRRNQP